MARASSDVSDIAEELGKGQGGFYDTSRAVANDGKKWIAVPWCIVGLQIAYRKSWFADIGYADGKLPETWEELSRGRQEAEGERHARSGKRWATPSATRRPSLTPILWSWGGKEVEADGKTVVLNSPATVDSVKFAVSFWKDAHDEGGLAWDDSTTTAPFCPARVLHAEWRVDLYRSQTQTRFIQDGGRQAAEGRYLPRDIAQRAPAGSSAITSRSRTC